MTWRVSGPILLLLLCPPVAHGAGRSESRNWSGWWTSDFRETVEELEFLAGSTSPMKPELRAALARMFTPGATRVGVDYCAPPYFVGLTGGGNVAIELLSTPGRLTITTEDGLIRRIYIGRSLPADSDSSNSGTSVAHWEGDTLVVQTVGLNPAAKFPFYGMPAASIGDRARVVERMRIAGGRDLQLDIVVDAPDVLSAPWKTTRHYRLQSGYVEHELNGCPSVDREVDRSTGAQRFDLTPPANLPPPPAE